MAAPAHDVEINHPLGDEGGATAVEYALLVALIAIVIVGAVSALGISVRGLFSNPELLDVFTP